MIYAQPPTDAALDQGDLIDGCPLALIKNHQSDASADAEIDYSVQRIVVLTQTCDLANQKAAFANVAEVAEADKVVAAGTLKPADIKGPLRGGRIWGLYFLPADAGLGLSEMIVDLRRLHTVRIDLLVGLCRAGQRRARLPTPYREHLAKHFADTFSRIGLPRPYETM